VADRGRRGKAAVVLTVGWRTTTSGCDSAAGERGGVETPAAGDGRSGGGTRLPASGGA